MTERLDQPDEDTVLDTNAEVGCPYCGETVALALVVHGPGASELGGEFRKFFYHIPS